LQKYAGITGDEHCLNPDRPFARNAQDWLRVRWYQSHCQIKKVQWLNQAWMDEWRQKPV
jgi:hypothetical protein